MSSGAMHVHLSRARGYLRDGLLALLIGAGIGLVFWMAREKGPLAPYLLASTWIGLWIFHAAIVLVALSRPLVRRSGGWVRRAVLGVTFFVAGGLGFYLAAVTLAPVSAALHRLTGESPHFPTLSIRLGSWGRALAFAGGLGVVVGFLSYRYEVLQSRLRQSIARLKEQEFAEKELEMARAIQRRILPPARIDGSGYRIAARNLPARVVAGDFYDVLPRSDGRVGLVVADVSGKGLGASLVMASVKAKLPFLAASRSVADTLQALNRDLTVELGRREFVALCFLDYDPASGAFEVANAGLPDPYVLAAGAAARALPAAGPRFPMGLRSEVDYEVRRGRLQVGERILLLTDGLPEAITEAGEFLGYEALEELLQQEGDRALEPEAWLQSLFDRVQACSRALRDDDWTALLLERTV